MHKGKSGEVPASGPHCGVMTVYLSQNQWMTTNMEQRLGKVTEGWVFRVFTWGSIAQA